MAKIMLVEDDKNLSAIYKDRLLAEGYDIVAAHDGEEALALAVKEKPVLIIADVMMPKISGFDMLDILRSTPETKNTKVIMMTALSQAEDQQRATQLGADKYLVKSQVTLDDVARVVKEVLESGSAKAVETTAPTEAPAMPTLPVDTTPEAPTTPPAEIVAPEPQTSTPVNIFDAATLPDVNQLPAEPIAQEKNEIENEIQKLADSLPTEAPAMPTLPVDTTPEAPTTPPAEIVAPEQRAEVSEMTTNNPDQQESGERIVAPVTTSDSKPDIMALYEQEMAKEASNSNVPQENNQNAETTDSHSISL